MTRTHVTPGAGGHDLTTIRLFRPGSAAWSAAVATLGRADSERLAGLSDSLARARLVTGRWELRRLAAARLGVPAREIIISACCPQCQGPHGQPRVRDGGGRHLVASVSRSGTDVLVAVADDGLIGVDLVEPDAADFAGFERQVMSAAEHAITAPPAGRARWRAHVWAAKEATLKALGRGLDISPTAVQLDEPGSEHATLARVGLPDRRHAMLHVTPVDTGNGLVAAMARNWPPSV